jgi:hypothetical protein
MPPIVWGVFCLASGLGCKSYVDKRGVGFNHGLDLLSRVDIARNALRLKRLIPLPVLFQLFPRTRFQNRHSTLDSQVQNLAANFASRAYINNYLVVEVRFPVYSRFFIVHIHIFE